MQRGISRIVRARVYLDLLVFCNSSPPDYMRVISGTGRGGLALFCASRESSFNVPSDCYTMAAHRVRGLTAKRASHVRKCPRCNEAPSEPRGLNLRRRYRAPLCRVRGPQLLCLWTTSPVPVLMVRHPTPRSEYPLLE
jgi:hypothetical protein